LADFQVLDIHLSSGPFQIQQSDCRVRSFRIGRAVFPLPSAFQKAEHFAKMADPATIAGLTLAVAPLIISALENYEYTLQPILIFSRGYQKEVQRFQDALKVQKRDFENECCFLLHSVTNAD